MLPSTTTFLSVVTVIVLIFGPTAIDGATVVLYSPRLWGPLGGWIADNERSNECGGFECKWTTSEDVSPDATLFYAGLLGTGHTFGLPWPETSNDTGLRILYEMEPVHKHYRVWKNNRKRVEEQFDGSVSWAISADSTVNMLSYSNPFGRTRFHIPSLYCSYSTIEQLRHGSDLRWKSEEEFEQHRIEERKYLLSGFVSNPKEPRRSRFAGLLQALGTRSDVVSFGAVEQSSSAIRERFSRKLRSRSNREAKIQIGKEFTFMLAWENEVNTDYVTEKVYDAFLSGSIPVYSGAPNILEFVPSRESIVLVDDFSTTEELAQYLIHVHENPERWLFHHKWRFEHTALGQMEALHSMCSESAIFCRLCSKVHELKGGIHDEL